MLESSVSSRLNSFGSSAPGGQAASHVLATGLGGVDVEERTELCS